MEIPSHYQKEAPYSSKDPKIHGDSVTIERLQQLKKIAPKAAVFFSIAESDEDTDSSGTDTGDEDEQNSIPEPLTSLFQPSAINDTKEELEHHTKKLYYFHERSYCQSQYDNLCEITRVQSLSRTWQLHRAGRITASIAKQAFNADSMDDGGYPKTFMTLVMQYGDEVDVPATRYGKAMESVARKSFVDYAQNHHDGFIAKDTGLHVLKDKPYLGASPDGLIECSCHGKGVLEIKCPYKYQNGLNGWSSDKSFPVSPDGVMRRKHAYFFQIQHQMLVTDRDYCHFYIWTKGCKETDKMLLTIPRDISFCKKLEEKLTSVFFKFLLPELVTRKHDPNNEKPDQIYCYCRRPTFLPMIACEGKNCKIEWFHYGCVGVTRAPEKAWYCKECKSCSKKK